MIVWTKTDESPLLASYSLLPIIKAFLSRADIDLKVVDISLAGRILSAFNLAEDGLLFLSELIKQKSANIIKTPNISASLPQLNSAILELRNAGFDIPLYPLEIKNKDDEQVLKIYQKILGSAVNPILRDGNSDRRSTKAVKEYARANPHFMGGWSKENKCEISSMQNGDFYGNEKAYLCEKSGKFSIKFKHKNSEISLLKDGISVEKNDVIDASFMSVEGLFEFYKKEIEDAKDKGLLFSLHLKASMMKVSDPVIFGECLKAYFCDIFTEFGEIFEKNGIKAQNGLKDIFSKLENIENGDKIRAKFDEILSKNTPLAMVDFENAVTNLHTPSDVIIDASMPQVLRNSGKMYDKNGVQKECKAVIPDRSYAGVYQAVLDDFKENLKLDVSKIGSVSNVGLMAQKAQEYGSHDKSFIASSDGEFIVLFNDVECFKFSVKKGDIFRMCLTRAKAIENWIELAINRVNLTKQKAIFWLDENRAVDKILIKTVKERLKSLENLGFEVLNPKSACKKTLETIRKGDDIISVTGNVLRDYLTDLFPILELGTSAKMLSIVPLLSGGALFETGAGGTAPVLVRELVQKNRIIWDSLGEFLALNASLEHLANFTAKKESKILATALDSAISRYLLTNKSPSAKFGEIDTRGSHYFIALFWAKALLDTDLKDKFEKMANDLEKSKDEILAELNSIQGSSPEDFGRYYIDEKIATNTMRPSKILNKIVG